MSASRPNIVFLFTDDQRRDTIHAIGNREIHTPNLDRLVAEGTTFTRACIMGGSSPAVCMPSRAMLHTGRTLYSLDGRGSVIPREHTTLGESLRAAGYHTHHVGKWHQDAPSLNRSFESGARIFGFTRDWYKAYGGHWNVAVHDYDASGEYPHETGYILAEDKTTRLPVEAGVGGVHSSEMFGDAAVEFLRDRAAGDDDRPFYLNVSFVAPHDPRESPDRFEEMYPASAVSLPPNFMPRHPFDNGELTIRDEMLEAFPRRRQAIREHIADYYAMITHADEQLGRVVRTLKQTGQYENTIIVFAGDNGLAIGQHGLMGKQNLYEHSVGVPLILAGPGVPRGQLSEAHAYLLDIFPTLCELTGTDRPASVEGCSLTPAFDNPSERIRETMLYAYMGCQRAARDERWKLIEYVAAGRRHTQLFDLWADPWELSNLADSEPHREHRDRLRDELRRWQSEWHDDKPEQGEVFWGGYDA
jgi:arylsulfatase A-like enzyme